MTTIATTWRPLEKFLFRLFFLLLGISSIFCWDTVVAFSLRLNYRAEFKFLMKPSYWLDRHLYHTGFDPARHTPYPGDTHYGMVIYLDFLLLALIGAIVWGFVDKKRPNYDRLLYWFRLYIRYVLAITIYSYGIDKLIPSQMPYPGSVEQLTRLGDSNHFSVLWNFMGLSPGYQMFTGAMEIIGSLLLLNRRTVAAGCLILLVMLVNIVALNICYHVSVKTFSSQLLVYCLFLLTPYWGRLIKLFFRGQAVPLTEPVYRFEKPSQNLILLIIVMGTSAICSGVYTIEVAKRFQQHLSRLRNEKIYDVTSFVAGDTIPPLDTDTLRFKRFVFTTQHYPPFRETAVIYDMQGRAMYFFRDMDSSNKTMTLEYYDEEDSLHWPKFHYSYPTKGQLLLVGTWEDREVQVSLQNWSVDSLYLDREKSRWRLD